MMKTKIISVSLILISATLTIAGQNLLVNGDFESSPPNGTFPTIGWQSSWYPAEAGAVTTRTAAKEGNCGLWMYTTAGSNAFSKPFQEVNCTPLTTYRAQAHFRCPSGQSWTSGTTAFISIAFKNSSGVTLKTINSAKMVSGSSEWKLHTVSLMAPGGSAKVRFTVNLTSDKGQSICNVDNCSLVPVK